MPSRHRTIVLIDEDDRFRPMVAEQIVREAGQRPFQLRATRLHCTDAAIRFSFSRRQDIVFQQVGMPVIFRRHLTSQGAARFGPRFSANRAQGEKHNRMSAALGPIPLAGSPDRKGFECPAIVGNVSFDRRLEIALEHAHGERLAKTARAAKKDDFVIRLDYVTDEHTLVDKHARSDNLGKVFVADGQRLVAGQIDNRIV